jgi:hypothetical protein
MSAWVSIELAAGRAHLVLQDLPSLMVTRRRPRRDSCAVIHHSNYTSTTRRETRCQLLDEDEYLDGASAPVKLKAIPVPRGKSVRRVRQGTVSLP